MLRSARLLLRRVWAFVVRDFQLTLSYRLQFFLRVLTILLMVTTLFFISKTFTGRADCPCAESPFTQWRDPLAAWITGLAVLNYFMTGFSSLANAIRAEQTQGTLESSCRQRSSLFYTSSSAGSSSAFIFRAATCWRFSFWC